MNRQRFLLLFGLATVATMAAFLTHLALRFQNVALGYAGQHAREEGQRLHQRVNQLRIELAARRSPQTLSEIGRGELGMVDADQVTTLVVGGGSRPARLSGRAR